MKRGEQEEQAAVKERGEREEKPSTELQRERWERGRKLCAT